MEQGQFGDIIRKDFPVFSSSDKRLVYLDTAASAQKPQIVIDALAKFYAYHYANIHRGAYKLSMESTVAYEEARKTVASFIHASDSECIIFTHGATEGFNLLAHTAGELLREGDGILLTVLEHHSNIVPWQMLAQRKKLNLAYVNVTDNALFDFEDFIEKLQSIRPRLLSVTYVSNAFGSVFPIADICAEAHKIGCQVVVDASQAIEHMSIDVQALDVDYLVFSGHKIYGPNGIGVVYGKKDLLLNLPPFLAGGDMIDQVTLEGTTFALPPQRFEAGTPAIVEAIGLGVALKYLEKLEMAKIMSYEDSLFEQAWNLLSHEQGVILFGTGGKNQASIISFNIQGVHPYDFATVADDFNVQIRVGHHCAMPAMKRLGVNATARLSFGIYSALEDVEQLIEAIRYARKLFK